jgi:hypothetical protein
VGYGELLRLRGIADPGDGHRAALDGPMSTRRPRARWSGTDIILLGVTFVTLMFVVALVLLVVSTQVRL